MPKIKIEIDATSAEISEIISTLINGKQFSRYAAFADFYKTGGRRPKYPIKHKTRGKKTPVTKSRPKARRGKAVRWNRDEVKWLKNYINNVGPINKKTVSAFRKAFGYKRSFSSLSNKANSIRKN
tara:strand:+ start:1555 stop:1929 length:375 start_codon:yes stop_codon:yes gene_type:complete